MSYLMDYGDDWPPPPEPPAPPTPKRRRRMPLWLAFVIAVVAYALVALGGLGLLALRSASTDRPLTPPAVSTTLTPAPCSVDRPCERSALPQE